MGGDVRQRIPVHVEPFVQNFLTGQKGLHVRRSDIEVVVRETIINAIWDHKPERPGTAGPLAELSEALEALGNWERRANRAGDIPERFTDTFPAGAVQGLLDGLKAWNSRHWNDLPKNVREDWGYMVAEQYASLNGVSFDPPSAEELEAMEAATAGDVPEETYQTRSFVNRSDIEAVVRDILAERDDDAVEEFQMLWEEYALCPDEELAPSGKRLKERLRKVVYGKAANRPRDIPHIIPAGPVRDPSMGPCD